MKAFEPFRIGKLELKNRLVVSAMVTNYCNPDGTPTEKYLAYHEHKARGGWVNIPPQTGQQNGGNRSRVTVEMSPGVRLQVQAVE